MRDYIVEDQKKKEREGFIASIDPKAIIKLASSYHQDDGCKIFGTRNGAFNVCFFVEFATASGSDAPDRWAVRIPIPCRVHWVEEKLEVEVATMKYVEANTSIPIPRIRAFSLAGDNPVGTPFIIMDYVDGYTLRELGFPADERWMHPARVLNQATKRVFEQLADVYVQLRGLEFPRIGALGLPGETRPGIQVCRRPLSVEVILQTDEKLDPTARFEEGTTFATTSEYADALLWLAGNDLEKGKNTWVDLRDGRKILYSVAEFQRFVRQEWLDPKLENGPFVLMHGDLSMNNLLWDADLNLRAVLDWEWSQVVPLQLLAPPVWLMGADAAALSRNQFLYNMEVSHLRAAIRDREKALGIHPPRLSEEWAGMDKFCHALVVSALFRPEYLYEVYWNFLARRTLGVPGRGLAGGEADQVVSARLEAFMDGPRTVFLARKRQEQAEYAEAEKRYFND